MALYTMMRPAKASCTAVHDLLICELTMAPKKNLTKKNTAVKSPVVKKIASKPKSSAKSSDKSVTMDLTPDMADMIKGYLKEKAAQEHVAAGSSDEDELEDADVQDKGKTKLIWTAEMEAELLEQRCVDYDVSFRTSKAVRQLSKYWSSIALAISIIAGYEINAKQCKAKYNKVEQTYQGIKRQERATGNTEDIVYPPNWDKYVSYLGDKSGLGSTEYSGLVGDVDIDDESQASDTNGDGAFSTPNKGTRKEQKTPTTDEQKQAEIKRQRDLRNDKKNNKLSVAASIATMGEAIREGLIQSAQPAQQPYNAPDVVGALASMQASMQETTRLQMLMIEMVQRALQGTSDKANDAAAEQ